MPFQNHNELWITEKNVYVSLKFKYNKKQVNDKHEEVSTGVRGRLS